MKHFVIGAILGATAAIAFGMTDAGCDFTCMLKRKFSKMCRCAERGLGKMQEGANEKIEQLRDVLKNE